MSIKHIQKRLKELGFDPGPVDGRNGPRTKSAVRAAQRFYGLKADGIVGPLTEAALWPIPIAERDIDPPVTASTAGTQHWPRQKDVADFYGPTGKQQTMLKLPYTMRLAWDKRVVINQFSVHEKVHDSALRCFRHIADTYTQEQRCDLGIDLFGGCLNVRKMRGGSRWSMHSWGIAIDFDPANNPLPRQYLKTSRLMQSDAEPFWRIWESEGWVSLGRTAGYDAMHVQAARL